jgi:hypothetical protein
MKLAIGREISIEKGGIIEAIEAAKIKFEEEKEWIEKSIFLAIKEKGLIKFKIENETLYGSLEIKQ